MAARPAERTLQELRKRGYMAAMVEKWNHHVKRRQDLFGFLDVIAVREGEGVLGVQACGRDFSEHIEKLESEEVAPKVANWLAADSSRLWLMGWRKLKVKRGGKAVRWTPRVLEFTRGGGRHFIEEPEEW